MDIVIMETYLGILINYNGRKISSYRRKIPFINITRAKFNDWQTCEGIYLSAK